MTPSYTNNPLKFAVSRREEVPGAWLETPGELDVTRVFEPGQTAVKYKSVVIQCNFSIDDGTWTRHLASPSARRAFIRPMLLYIWHSVRTRFRPCRTR